MASPGSTSAGESFALSKALREHWVAIGAWLWAATYLLWTRTEPLRINWGDPWSDCNVQTSGRYFATYGFFRTAFTPIIDVGPLDAESVRYTHYPPLPDVVNGLEQRLFGESDIAVYRLVADVLTLTSLYFFYRWAHALWGSIASGVALLLLTKSLIWLQYADTIHHIPLYTLFGYAALHASARWIDERKPWLLAFAAGSACLCNLASYDYLFVVPILLATTLWLKNQRLRDRSSWPLMLAVGGGIVAAIVTKLALVAMAVGLRSLIADFVFQLQERTTAKHSVDYRAGFHLILFWRTVRFFTPIMFIVLGVQLIALARHVVRRAASTSIGAEWPPASPLLVLLAGVPFIAIFSQLFVEQYHPTLLLLPYYAVGTGCFVAWLWRQKGGVSRPIALALVGVAVCWEARETISFPKVFFRRSDIAAVKDYLETHDRQRFVVTNSVIDAPFRFYLNRHTLGIGHDTTRGVAIWATAMLDETGNEAFHFVWMGDVEHATFDKTVYQHFVRQGKWSWIANPAAHKDEWMPVLREHDTAPSAAVAEVGRLVVDRGDIKVYAFDRSTLDEYLWKVIGSEETRVINFGELDSYKFKIQGLRPTELLGDGTGHSWTSARERRRLRFSLKGPTMEPVPNSAEPIARLRLRAAPAASTLRIELYTEVENETVELFINGHRLGESAVTRGQWAEHRFDIAAELFDPSGRQILELRPAKLSSGGTGVALRMLHLDRRQAANHDAPQ